MQITLQKGANASHIASLSEYAQEQEVLIARNTALRVVEWLVSDRVLKLETL